MAIIKVNQSITIAASPKKIFPILNNLKNWQAWSPWTLAEPDVEVEVSSDGKSYSWEGKVIGAGKLTIVKEAAYLSISYDLSFLKPWKSKAKTHFTLHKNNNQTTTLTWSMVSKLPFFLFWMRNSMQNFIGMDYDRGLKMLKDLVEQGDSLSHLKFIGEKYFGGLRYIGIQTKTPIELLEKSMEDGFSRLRYFVKEKSSKTKAAAKDNRLFSIYHKWDFKRKETTYTAGIAFNWDGKKNEARPAEFIQGEIPPQKSYAILHQGPYRHLANAWSAQMMFQRAKIYQVDNKFSPLELYYNDPANTSERNLKTEVLVGIK